MSGHRRPSIVVLTTTFPGRDGDGTPAFVQTLATAMADEAEVVVVAPRMPGAERDEWIGPLHVVRFRYFPRRWEDLATGAILPGLRERPDRFLQVPGLVLGLLLAAWREVRRGADVVHAHWIVPAGLIGVLLTRTPARRLVVTIHGADAYALEGRFSRLLKRWVLSRADVVVPVSGHIAEAVGLPPDQARPMGIDPEVIVAEVGERRPVAGRVLFIGRLAEKKGVDDLIRAVALLPDVELRIGGDGPMRKALGELADDVGVADRVHFLGQVRRETVMAELAQAQAFAIPSKVASDGDRDGTPVVLMEAVAAGVPVVATDLGGLGEHLSDGENSLVVSPGDVAGLAAALDRLTSDPELAAHLAERARIEVLPVFDVREIADHYLQRMVGG